MLRLAIRRTSRAALLLGSTMLAMTPAWAQTSVEAQVSTPLVGEDAAGQETMAPAEDIVITGSRIRRANTATAAPITVIDPQTFAERGFVQAGQALNQVTSNVPAAPLGNSGGGAAGNGQQFPNLFGLGAGRTLTLLNGRRMVTSSSGLGDSTVDTNIVPVGLIRRIDVVQAGGAAVYGSDAIAGVVNYILRDDFSGLELDAQGGIATRGDYPQRSLRATAGRNFGGGRGNIAANVEWSKTDPLYAEDRPRSNLARTTASNPLDTGPADGIPAVSEVLDTRFWQFNPSGVIYTVPFSFSRNGILQVNGRPSQFAADGQSVVPYDTGLIRGIPFASGGDGFSFRRLSALYSGVERLVGNAIGHYDLSDRVKLSGEFLYADVDTHDPLGNQGGGNIVLNPPGSASGAIPFYSDNAFLSAAARSALGAARPAFTAGGPLYLSKQWDTGLYPTRAIDYTNRTLRGLASLSGDIDAVGRTFYWSISGSYARQTGSYSSYDTYTSRFNNAVDAVRNPAGQIVCRINADADRANDDPGCVPLDIFGADTATAAQKAYVSVPIGQRYANTQQDYLATLGGDIARLPGGRIGFSLAYEHRRERARFTPSAAEQAGIAGEGVVSVPQAGRYHTHEFAAELLVPLVGGEFTLPLVRTLELTGAYRHVRNSLAGGENVWSAGGRWDTGLGVALRGSRSRNFRAPTLNQLIAPSVTALGSVSVDPCDADRINDGPAPANRLANCRALFAANPSYGSLATFQDPAEVTSTTLVTTGGNADLRNEVAKTTTYGIVVQPGFVPGLTFVADRVEVHLTDGLSLFTPEDFTATCYDSVPQPAGVCSTFTRNAQGYINTARATTFNAGSVRYHGEVYNLSYRFPLGGLFGGRDLGTVELGVEATHTSLLETSVTGFDLTRSDDTVTTPEWSGRLDARYAIGGLRVFYSVNYLSPGRTDYYATIESTPTPTIRSNTRHNASVQYTIRQLTLRAGVNNIFDRQPSFPTRNYGDILGRQLFVGAHMAF